MDRSLKRSMKKSNLSIYKTALFSKDNKIRFTILGADDDAFNLLILK